MRRARHLKPFVARLHGREPRLEGRAAIERTRLIRGPGAELRIAAAGGEIGIGLGIGDDAHGAFDANLPAQRFRSEEHTSELQSLMRISYAVFCLKKKTSETLKNPDTKAQSFIYILLSISRRRLFD